MDSGFRATRMRREEIDELEGTFDESECLEFVEGLIESESLDNDIAVGVCKFFVENGYEALSDKQKNVLKITLQQNVLKCGRGDACDFSWGEAQFIIDNGLCSYCQHVWDKD